MCSQVSVVMFDKSNMGVLLIHSSNVYGHVDEYTNQLITNKGMWNNA